MKLGLGSAQFGLDYGISNPAGRVSPDQAAVLLARARTAGVDLFDTAPRYGDAERVLGELLPTEAGIRIVTKTPQFGRSPLSANDAGALVAAFGQSLARLRRPAVYGLLVHQAEDLLAEGGASLMQAMIRLKRSQVVEKIGVSIYTGDQIDRILERFEIDMVQLPLNVLDQRLLASGHLAALKARNVEIHVRSVFLQGLLLMDPDRLAPWFKGLKPHLRQYREWLAVRRLSAVQGAIAFLRHHDCVDYAIVGVTADSELAEVLDAWRCPVPETLDFARFACAEEKYVNPVLWPAGAK